MNIFKRMFFSKGESSKQKQKEEHKIEEVQTSNFDDSSDNLKV